MTKEEFLEERKNTVNYGNPSIVAKTKHEHKMLKIGFTIFIIVATAVIGILVYKTLEQRKENISQANKIENLESVNSYLTRKDNERKNYISRLERNNRTLNNSLKNKYKTRKTYAKKKTYTKPKTAKKTTKKTYVRSETPTYNKSKTYTPTQRKTHMPTKRYQKFSNHIKLVSDSRITKQNDNRLKSNAPIYGRYYDKHVSNIKCNSKQNLYNVEDECSMTLFLLDTVYLSKSNINNVKNFNSRTHMIECDYSKNYGVMHDCSVKLKAI